MEELFRRIVSIPTHRKLARADFRGKRVLVRFDFNVPIEDGKVEDVKRIAAAIPTIKKIIEKGAEEINIVCHLGRPKGGAEEPEFSVKPVGQILADLMKLKIDAKPTESGIDSPALAKFYKIGTKIKLFENLRFDTAEEKNSIAFAKKLATLGDYFVLDAFANIHRAHASMLAIQDLLPTYAGLLVEMEVSVLFRILNKPDAPFIAIIGGAKIADKLPIIEALAKRADAILVGGMVANEWILEGRGVSENVYLPADGLNENGAIVAMDEEKVKKGVFDIGPQTIMLYKSILSSAKTIFWNGNLGMTENKRFAHGTYEIIRFVSRLKAEKVASGGNTAEVIDEIKMEDGFDFISTGGSATSDFIAGKKLPVLEKLLK